MAKKTQGNQPSQRSRSSQAPFSRKETATLPDLIEIINTKNGPRFFMSDGTCKDFVLKDGINWIPTNPKLFLIPDERVLVCLKENDTNLFDNVCTFISNHLDCPDERHYPILTSFVLHTHLIEKAEASPIIRFYGAKGSGKSRGGEVLSQIVRRGISTANLTGPGLFRVNELYEPTLTIDEIQIFGKKGDQNLKDLLNVRYRRGNKIIRINKDRSGLESIEMFNAFGPTVLCGTEELPDTIKSRSITFFMEPNARQVKRHIDKSSASDLRNRLTAFRFRHFNTSLDEPERVVSNGRLDEVLLPLHQIIKLEKPEFEPDFVTFAKSLEADRIEEDFESFDAEVCRALINSKSKVTYGKIAVDEVTSEVNKRRGLSNLVSQRWIGSVLTRFGLKTCRFAGTGKYGRIWDEDRIRRLARGFGIPYP